MMLKVLSTASAVFVVLSLWASAGVAGDPPRVVVSIKPVHSLVAAVMEGVANPDLLLAGAGSPHAYALRPSDALALQEADAVFWIGENLEGFLARPLQALARGARLVTLHEAEGVRLLPGRESGGWQAHAHSQPDRADAHEHGHQHENADMHIWLDPQNAQAMVRTIAKTLSQIDSRNKERYTANASLLDQRLTQLDIGLRERLAPVQGVPYIVFHDAYQYFEERYDLNAVGSLTVMPESQPGARRLYEIRARIIATGAQCVFSEPQFESALVETLVAGTRARTGVLDPLGATLAAGPDAYFELMHQLAKSLRSCLDEAE
jgi:zinc transport system substrate-binding protein